MQGEGLLDKFKTNWELFSFSAKVFSNVCNYINRYWVKRQNDENRPTPDVYQV